MLVTECCSESRCDHGYDEELRYSPEVKTDIWIIVFSLRKGFWMFPEMFGYENTIFGPRGKAHEALGRCKRSFA